MTQPRIVSVLNAKTYELVFSPEAEERFQRFANFVRYDGEANLDDDGLIDWLRDADGVVTSWGVKLTDRVIRETNLRIIGHAAGTVKGFPPLVWERGIAVTHAAPIIAVAVGEMALALTLACLRHIPEHDAAFKRDGQRGDSALDPRLLTARTLHGLRVGIVGASSTGREFLRLLRAFGDVEVWVHDPYLGPPEAAALGVRLSTLDDLFASCDVVSLHCPLLPETTGLVDARRIGLLKDGAVLINTARGKLVDHNALLADLRAGRISAGLDVYLETLSADEVPVSAYRALSNVVITPGIAGPVGALTKRMATFIAGEMERFFGGQPPLREIKAEMLSRMA